MKNTIPTIEYALQDRTDYTDSAFLVTALHWANQNGVWSAFKRLLDIDMKTVVYSPMNWLVKAILCAAAVLEVINSRQHGWAKANLPARRERTASGWRLHLLAQQALARLFVHVLRPK